MTLRPRWRTALLGALAVLVVHEARAARVREHDEHHAREARDTVRALALLNEARAGAGLPPVVLDSAMSAACLLHAKYVAANEGTPFTAGLTVHHEDRTRPGYTISGADAGDKSDIDEADPLPEAIAAWLDSLYHRTPMLRPEIRRVGMASVLGKYGEISILMFEDAPLGKDRYPVKFPYDGQRDVPTMFTGETPNPFPADDPAGGYPVTLGCGGYYVDGVEQAELLDSSGNVVPTWLSTPAEPAGTFGQGNVICMLPKRPLRPAHRYTAHVRVDLHGIGRHDYRWSFETTTPREVDATNARALDAAAGQLVHLTGPVLNAGAVRGYWFLTLGGSPTGSVVNAYIDDAALPTFRAAGDVDPQDFINEQISLVTVLKTPTADGGIEAHVVSPEDLTVVTQPEQLPLLEIPKDARALRHWIGRLVRVRGHVRRTYEKDGYLQLLLSDTGKDAPTIYLRGPARAAIDRPSKVEGRLVTAQGILQQFDGGYLGIVVQKSSQLGWSGPAP